MKALIAGQGLAGSCMALELLDRGVEVLVADPYEVNRSTSVAAGLINPLVLKRMKKVWRADEFIESSASFYGQWENRLSVEWRHKVPVYRRFHNVSEQNQWMELSTDSGVEAYIDPNIEKVPDSIGGDWGMAKVNSAGWFDTQLFMDTIRAYLYEQNAYVPRAVVPEEIQRKSRITWNNEEYDIVVWANGVAASAIPDFPNDALRPSKGELLRLKLHEMWPTEAIVKAGVFILPLGRKELRVGATYDHFDLEPGVSKKGQAFLKRQVADLIRVPYEIAGREWGIRPTTKDRRPIMGRNPQQMSEYFFNGLGSRGVLMAPLLARELADLILEGKGLRPDVDVARFY